MSIEFIKKNLDEVFGDNSYSTRSIRKWRRTFYYNKNDAEKVI